MLQHFLQEYLIIEYSIRVFHYKVTALLESKLSDLMIYVQCIEYSIAVFTDCYIRVYQFILLFELHSLKYLNASIMAYYAFYYAGIFDAVLYTCITV